MVGGMLNPMYSAPASRHPLERRADCDALNQTASISPPADTSSEAPGLRLERSIGRASLTVEHRAGEDRVTDLFQSAPCRILFPTPRSGDPLTAVTLTTSGGLTGGDHVSFDLKAGAGARLTVASQAAEKIYRSFDHNEVKVDVAIQAGDGAWVEWLMQETILFDQACLARETAIECSNGAHVLATEGIVLGRTAAGERFARGHCRDRWIVRRNGRPVWIEAQSIDGEQLDAPFGLDGRIAFATLLLVGDEAENCLYSVRCCIAASAMPAFATVIGSCLIVRVAADDAMVARQAVAQLAGHLRHLVAGLPPSLPTVWQV